MIFLSLKQRNKFDFTTCELVFVRFSEEIEDIKDILKLTDLYLIDWQFCMLIKNFTITKFDFAMQYGLFEYLGIYLTTVWGQPMSDRV